MSANLTILIIIVVLIHFFIILREDRKLKQLHNYLIDTITFDDRLSYEEIVDYLKDIPQLKKLAPDPGALLATLEASIESPFSIRKVIYFRILFRDIEIVLGSIIIPFISSYILIGDRYWARITGSVLAASLLLIYAEIKQTSSGHWAPKFIKHHPTFTLRSGGVDRVYLKFFPEEVKKLKEETILTILTQSVALSRALGLAFLGYAVLATFISLAGFSPATREFIEFVLINALVIPTSARIIQVAREGTQAWVHSVEKRIQELDKRLKSSVGFTPIDIAFYLDEARNAREAILEGKNN
jgi:hypothetical protein